MDVLQVIVLAILQGLTEFLPISSSAHLILVPILLGWEDQGLAFDVAVHVGTLAAVVFYFAADLWGMVKDLLRSLSERHLVGDSKLALFIVAATIPTGLAGLAFNALVGDELRRLAVIALANIIFALALWWVDRQAAQRSKGLQSLTVRDALVVGCAQALALIPGTSRSGVTMTAALAMGYSRQAAARFSFLLAVPLIALAGGLKGYEAVREQVPVDWSAIGLGVLLSALFAFACIHVFLKLLERVGMLPFVIYRLLLGAVLLVYLF